MNRELALIYVEQGSIWSSIATTKNPPTIPSLLESLPSLT